MKILHVTPTYIPAYQYGGPIFSVHRLCREQMRLGHEVFVFTSTCNGKADLDVPKGTTIQIDGVKVKYYGVILFRWLYIMPSLITEIRKQDFDIVHIHSVFNFSSTMAMWICRIKGIPYVLSPRGMLDNKLIQKKKPIIKRMWIKFIDLANYRNSSLMHFTTELEKQQYEEVVQCKNDYCVVPNGIEVPDLENVNKSKNILYLGRLNWKKNILNILESLVYIKEYHLILVGHDEDGLWEVISGRANELGLSDRVHYRGEKQGQDKESIIRNAFCLMLVSESENFGNVVLEAMSLGTAVVVSEGVGLSSTIREKFAGLVVSPNPKEISEAVRKLENNAIYYEVTKNARATVLEKFDITKVGFRMISEYARAIDKMHSIGK